MLTENQGRQVLTTEMLKENQSLVEASFFVANPRTGAGLFAHHYQAAPLHSGLFVLFSNSFQALQEGEMKAATEDEQLSDADRKKRHLDLKGQIWPQQLVMEEGFKKLVASLKSVSTIKVRLATVSSAKRLFQGYGFMPERETCEFKIPKGALPAEIAECLDHALTTHQLTDAKVTGLTSNDTETNVSKDKNKNPQVFDIQDYDELMKGFELDISDYMKTLLQAKVIKHLIAIARGRSVWQLLEKA